MVDFQVFRIQTTKNSLTASFHNRKCLTKKVIFDNHVTQMWRFLPHRHTHTHTYHGKLVNMKFGSRDSPRSPSGNLLKQSHFCPLAQQVNFICTTQRASTLMFYAQPTSTVRSGQTTQRTGGGGGVISQNTQRTKNYLFFKSGTQILHLMILTVS